MERSRDVPVSAEEGRPLETDAVVMPLEAQKILTPTGYVFPEPGTAKQISFDAAEQLQLLMKGRELLSLEERVQRREEYKESLLRQKDCIARTIVRLRRTVEQSPDVSLEDLQTIVLEGSAEGKFTPVQLAHFDEGIKGYLRKHAAVEKYRSLFPIDADLFQECFEKKPIGKVQVIKGPMTLRFQCFNKDDFSIANVYHFLKKNEEHITRNQIEQIDGTNAAALGTVKIGELHGTVTLQKMESTFTGYTIDDEGNADRAENKKVLAHENQHQFHRLFPKFEDTLIQDAVVQDILKRKLEIGLLIRALVRRERTIISFEDSVKNEILALYADGKMPVAIYQSISTDPLYAFNGAKNDDIRKMPVKVADIVRKQLDDQRTIKEADVQPHIKVVFEEEYERDLPRWINAILQLEETGRTRKQVLALLGQEPMSSWPNLARRMKAANTL